MSPSILRNSSIAIGLSLLWLMLQGCASVGSAQLREQIRTQPGDARDRLHVHFINSPLDVPQLGRLSTVAAFFRSAGLKNTQFHAAASGDSLAALAREIRRQEPDARIVLIGWSGASLWVWDALQLLEKSDEVIDLIVYLDSNWIKKRTASQGHPENVANSLLIYRLDNPPVSGVPHSRVEIIPTRQHLAVAAHPRTVRVLGEYFQHLIEESSK